MPGATEIGPADPDEEIKVTVLVRRRPQSSLPSLVDENAAKPLAERRYLTRDELASQHGADPSDLAKVAEWARQKGLGVVETNQLNRTVVLRARVADLSSAFQVKLARYRHDTGTYRGRIGAVQVPADLADIVEGVLGLDDRPQAQPRLVFPAEAATPVAPARAVPFTPAEIARLYQFPPKVDGQGESIGIIELGGGYKAADIQKFFKDLKIPKPIVVAVSVDGATNSPSTPPAGPDYEVGLDVEVAGAVAPGAKIAVYFAPNTDQGFLDAITAAVHDTTNNPSVVSISWGAAEINWTNQSMDAIERVFQDAAALGVTVFCASGDNGSTDAVADGLAHVDFPASAPHAVGCGGTHLEAAKGAITSEVVWSGSGGGISDHFDLPTWQDGVGVPTSVNPNKRVGRGVPDVSGNADSATGYRIVVGSSTITVGGTSAVAPLWSGLIAVLNQALGKRLGFLNPIIYSPAARSTFRDIRNGNNGAYSAALGWDACSGLGSPDGVTLLGTLQS
jgi:kumamolisin